VEEEEETEMMAKVPHILKALYDNDLVDEEALFEWHTKVNMALETV